MSNEPEMIGWAQSGVSFLLLALFVAGLVAALVYRRASGFTTLIAAGFALCVFAWLMRLLHPALYRAGFELAGVYLVDNVVHLIGLGLVVGGLFAVLGDVCRRLNRAGQPEGRGDDYYGRRRDYGGEPPAALPRNPGSPDIQR
jgi:hypothetical protein